MKLHSDYKTISITRITIGVLILSALGITNVYLFKTLGEYKNMLEFTTQEKDELQAKYLEARKELDRPLHYIDMEKLNEIVKNREGSSHVKDGFEETREKRFPGIQYTQWIEEIQTDGNYIKLFYKSKYLDKNGNDLSDIPGYSGGWVQTGIVLKDGSIKFDNSVKLPKTFVPYNSPYFENTNE